jgi:serine/threonine protein kinase
MSVAKVPAQSAPASARDPFLQAGTIVQIQDVLYCVREPLGMGSFGAVWSASRQDGSGEVAIKEILCRSSKDLDDVTLEAQLLTMIHEASPLQLSGRVPNLVGKEAQSLGPEQWIMRLAMTKVSGIQLDTFMDMCRAPALQPSAADHTGSSAAALAASATIAAQCCSLAGACRFVRALLSQLAFIFDCMSPVVYHRDVSPHNILIDANDSTNPLFGLVDFGLGIDMQSWSGPKGPTSWHYADIGGDCRYWPISVWTMFVSGSRELDKKPALSREYQQRLDFHAVGITVLEVLMTLLPLVAVNGGAIQSLRTAWGKYWQDVNYFWKRTMEVFDSGQDPSELKRWIKMEGRVTEVLSAHITSIRTALRKAANTCSMTGPADASKVFLALLELVSNGGQDPLETPKWRTIRSIVDSDYVPATVPHVGTSGSMLVPSRAAMAVSYNGTGSLVVPSGSKLHSPALSPGAATALTLPPQYAAVRFAP